MPPAGKTFPRKTVARLTVSAVSLLVSFLEWGNLPADAAWLAVLLCGLPIVKDAAAGLARWDIKADFLVAVALAASVLSKEVFAAGEVAFIMTIGSCLEESTVAKARAGIERLSSLKPTTARVVRGRQEFLIPAAEVQKGDILRVLPGETIAVDGIISRGDTSVDQSLMTGESLPVDKTEGDEVFGGTVNQFGAFDMVAQKVGEDTSLRRMARLVEEADAGKAKIVRLADRWATWIVAAALLTAAATWLATGEVIRAVSVLVVFCPCALVLATPTAIMAAIGNAAGHGVLVRAGDALERVAEVKTVIFDKTGTLTRGRPSVTKAASFLPGLAREELLDLAASAEALSEHPLGKAVTAYYKELTGRSPVQPDSFQMLAGRGVLAEREGVSIVAGNEALLTMRGIEFSPALIEEARAACAEGCSVIYVAVNRQAAGLIALSDPPRPDCARTVEAIHAAGAATLLLTGDTWEAAGTVAAAAGITSVKAACLPEDKLAVVQSCEAAGRPVCMVGDGVNDAPALRAARAGIAMGAAGSDIAIDAADIALTGDDIKEIPHLLLLARRTVRTININLAASMLLNSAAVVFAAAGLLGPVPGALLHNAGSVAVIINSALLLNWRERS